ncbi:MAG: RNA 2',3'-cyclic phosphodiesterase [Candidatus Calescibacterium sp.]|nr:RNA 2',3'-cyclic phosphodiesterase [Candidatus Calescibacterium sp.]MCX7733407.1 RNA 2',3'-cyclic phosphodiesterase [bacterium]MDW8087961.1 RNA 2',3'-cyclic phosphodiesterase [Candidatus Calescibacterium sp.]
MARVFIAIKIPEEISEKINQFAKQNFSKIPGIKLVEKENLHITMKFLGEINDEMVPRVSEKIEKSSQLVEPFEISVEEIGVFPSFNTPRVIWIGALSQKIYDVKKAVDETLSELGFEKENKFVSHITIGRVKSGNPSEKINRLAKTKTEFGKFIANSITIFESTLTPQGPIYKVIKDIKFGKHK